MKGDRVVDEGVLLESVWDGAHRGRDADLFNPPEFVEPQPITFGRDLPLMPEEIKQSHDDLREQLLRLLATKPRWRVGDLREVLGVDKGTINGILARLDVKRLTVRPDHGVVALRQSAREAA